MDDLLIIILTLIVALVGVFGRKKKGNDASSTGQASSQPKDFWDMFMEEEHQPKPAFIEEEEDLPEEVVFVKRSEQPRYQFKPEEEGKSDIKEELAMSLNPEPTRARIDGEEFSLRKAVIYSEILNRKYT